jgi:hypothetical protein
VTASFGLVQRSATPYGGVEAGFGKLTLTSSPDIEKNFNTLPLFRDRLRIMADQSHPLRHKSRLRLPRRQANEAFRRQGVNHVVKLTRDGFDGARLFCMDEGCPPCKKAGGLFTAARFKPSSDIASTIEPSPASRPSAVRHT